MVRRAHTHRGVTDLGGAVAQLGHAASELALAGLTDEAKEAHALEGKALSLLVKLAEQQRSQPVDDEDDEPAGDW